MRKIGNRFVAQIRPLAEGPQPPCTIYHVIDIVKMTNGEAVPENEPLFLIRGRDRLALAALLYYRDLCVTDECNDYLMGLLDESIEEFRKFRAEHNDRMKQPGVTRGT